MRILELIRLEEDANFGTFGILKIDKRVFCFTLEPADVLNETDRSSIPAQQYICQKVVSPRFGKTFEVTDVPGRNHILFHPGNTVNETEGCIILGERVGMLRENRAVLNSGHTFDKFMALLNNDEQAHLTIREVY